MNRQSLRFALFCAVAATPLTAAAQTDGEPVFSDSFERGFAHWEVLDPETWRVNDDGTVEITARDSDYKPPHRSPKHVALVQGLTLADGAIELRVKSTKDTGGHRDCCVFFGWQDPAHFYYAHVGAKPDRHSGQIQIVDGADRAKITDNQNGAPWDDQWHTVRLERDTQSGRIAVYFDGELLMQAVDTTFGEGRVGVGSFDDLNAFDWVRVYEASE
ncbi:hypothetical protein [Botrimarina sp.]|uniref:hypothetical protein n=1 Tax=Botrimarina sp. TaxID=2795802 RepID=UPI0032EE2C6A